MTNLAGPLIAFSGSRNFDDRALVEKVMRRLVTAASISVIAVTEDRTQIVHARVLTNG